MCRRAPETVRVQAGLIAALRRSPLYFQPLDLTSGTRLGACEVIAQIGEGRMGQVLSGRPTPN